MTTQGGPVPTLQNCPSCNALVYYEGHSQLRSNLVPHRFHCHACGNVYLVRSTSNKPPRFRITMRHMAAGPTDLATAEAIAQQGPDHGEEQTEDSGDAPVVGEAESTADDDGDGGTETTDDTNRTE